MFLLPTREAQLYVTAGLAGSIAIGGANLAVTTLECD